MIKVGVFYPQSKTFDWDYYIHKHMALVERLLKPALTKAEVDRGIAGGAPGTNSTYQCVCQLHFESVEAYQAAIAPHAQEIRGDIANYTDAQPVIQISEVKL